MERVKRFDRGELASPKRDSRTGYLRADGFITRTGVFTYLTKDGKKLRELRLPEEVFNSDSIASFDDVALTNTHPVEDLTTKNTQKHQVGSVRSPKRNDSRLQARITITHEDAITAAEAGRQELSCGYTAELEMTGGITDGIEGVDDGLKFDAIQRNIRGNHVAMVDAGRAGSAIKMRLDAADAFMIDNENNVPGGPGPTPKETPMTMQKKRIDGIEIEFTDQGLQAVEKLLRVNDEMAEKSTAVLEESEKQKARADKAEEELTKLKKDTDEKLSDAAISKRVKDRVKLITDAYTVLGEKDDAGKEIKLDDLSTVDIQKTVIAKVFPEAKLDDQSEDYVKARYDSALDTAKKDAKNEPTPPKKHPAGHFRNPRTDGARTAEQARKDMVERNRNAWKQEKPSSNAS